MPNTSRNRLLQIDIPRLIRQRLETAAEMYCEGNKSEYVRKWLYRGLVHDKMLTPTELAAALAGMELADLQAYIREQEETEALRRDNEYEAQELGA